MIVYAAHVDTLDSKHDAFLKEIGACDADLIVCVRKFLEPAADCGAISFCTVASFRRYAKRRAGSAAAKHTL
jgi:hypothetical protein